MTTNYRVIQTLTNDFGLQRGGSSKVDETVKWSGNDIDELSHVYPRSNVFGADELGHSEIEGGGIRFDYHFERQNAEGDWERIDDPRRLFPGDFVDQDDYDDED